MQPYVHTLARIGVAAYYTAHNEAPDDAELDATLDAADVIAAAVEDYDYDDALREEPDWLG